MNSILFVIDRPAESNVQGRHVYNSVLSSLRSSEPTAAQGEMLGTNCWLLTLPDGVPVLGSAIVECDKAGIPYRLLILQDEDLNWIVPTSRS